MSLAVRAPHLPRSRPVRVLLSAVLATGLLAGAVPSGPLPKSTRAATTPALQAYALVIVGPTEGATASYIRYAKTIASQLRSLGARVTTLYSPHATWAAVKRAATGANLLIYLGHGNGWPNPHRSVSDPKKDNGFGLNIADGTSAKRYYGEYYMHQLKLAKGAVVIFNHACYTAGSAETGYDKTPAKPFVRADGYSSAFIAIGARATLATAGTPGPFISALFSSRQTVEEAFWAMPTTYLTSATQRHPSKHVAGSVILQAPKPATRYYDAVSGDLSYTAAEWRATWK